MTGALVARTAALVIAALLVAGFVPSDAASKKKRPDFQFFGKFALRLVYDDNIIHYSDEDLGEFGTAEAPGKYSISTAGDWILRPRLEVGVGTRKITGKKLEVLARISAWRYVENGVKNNESFWIRLKHAGFGSDNFQLAYYYAPESYLRNFRDRAPFQPRSTVPYAYRPFTYSSSSLGLGYWRRLTKKLDGKVTLSRSWRYYNQAFMENDNWEWRIGGYLSYRVAQPLRVTAEYFYSDVVARAADAEGETRESSDDGDASYRRDSYKLTLGFYLPRTFLQLWRVNLSGAYQAYFFTSAKSPVEDPYHVGRRDEIFRVGVSGYTRPFMRRFVLEGGYRYTLRDSSAPYEGSGGESIDEDKDYTDDRFWIGIEYSF